jgi:hypothetical protein
MSPIQLLDNDEDTDEWIRSRKKFWVADPVHMTAEGYAELTRVLTMAASNANYDRAKEEGPAAAPAVNTAKSQRPPPRAFKRQEWVSAEMTLQPIGSTRNRNISGEGNGVGHSNHVASSVDTSMAGAEAAAYFAATIEAVAAIGTAHTNYMCFNSILNVVIPESSIL